MRMIILETCITNHQVRLLVYFSLTPSPTCKCTLYFVDANGKGSGETVFFPGWSDPSQLTDGINAYIKITCAINMARMKKT